MVLSLSKTALAAAILLSFAAAPAAFAQNAMAPATGAMAPATDAMAPAAGAMAPATGAMAPATGAMAPMSEADLKKCLEHAGTVTPADAMKAATEACHTPPTGAMGGNAMAPKQ